MCDNVYDITSKALTNNKARSKEWKLYEVELKGWFNIVC